MGMRHGRSEHFYNRMHYIELFNEKYVCVVRFIRSFAFTFLLWSEQIANDSDEFMTFPFGVSRNPNSADAAAVSENVKSLIRVGKLVLNKKTEWSRNEVGRPQHLCNASDYNVFPFDFSTVSYFSWSSLRTTTLFFSIIGNSKDIFQFQFASLFSPIVRPNVGCGTKNLERYHLYSPIAYFQWNHRLVVVEPHRTIFSVLCFLHGD